MKSQSCIKVSKKIIETLYTMAIDVAPVSRARVVAALVYKGKILAYGVNERKTHPMAARYSKNPKAIYLHAEVACVKNALKRYDLNTISKSTLYVVRAKLSRSFEFIPGLAKPCPGCIDCIEYFGIKNVIYTTDTPDHYGIFMR